MGSHLIGRDGPIGKEAFGRRGCGRCILREDAREWKTVTEGGVTPVESGFPRRWKVVVWSDRDGVRGARGRE